jgi:hypothetical protein
MLNIQIERFGFRSLGGMFYLTKLQNPTHYAHRVNTRRVWEAEARCELPISHGAHDPARGQLSPLEVPFRNWPAPLPSLNLASATDVERFMMPGQSRRELHCQT